MDQKSCRFGCVNGYYLSDGVTRPCPEHNEAAKQLNNNLVGIGIIAVVLFLFLLLAIGVTLFLARL